MNVFNRYLVICNSRVDRSNVDPKQSLRLQVESVFMDDAGISSADFLTLMESYAQREGTHGRHQAGERPFALAFSEEDIVVFKNAGMIDKSRFEEGYGDFFPTALIEHDDFIRLKAAIQANREGRAYQDVIAEKDMSATRIPPEELNT